MKAKEFIPASKPRNPVVRQQQTSGAGAHRDKKKEQKQGYEKHKGKDVAESDVMEYETHRYTDDQGNEWEVNDEGYKTLIRAGYGSSSRRSYNRPKPMRYPKPKGYYFYNVPADKENDARTAGLRQSKSGKWFDTMTNSKAEQLFGKGRYWEPKN